jgi:nucleoid DNA-binding protein
MNRDELVLAVQERTGLSRVDTEQVVKSVFDQVADALVAGETVRIVGFGAFEVRRRRSRMGRDPKSGRPIPIPATRTPFFLPSENLKSKVKGRPSG